MLRPRTHAPLPLPRPSHCRAPPWRVPQTMVALYIFQLTMLGLLGVKKFGFTVLLIPLVIGTIIYHMSTLSMFSRPWCEAGPGGSSESEGRGGGDTHMTPYAMSPALVSQ